MEPHTLSVAPMMDRTDRHLRFVMRQITRQTLLYTEMVTTGAILRGDRERFLRFDPSEHPVALQLGGDDPNALAECARIAADSGYDEVDLNVGCPSDRVQQGCFGVVLMRRPAVVARCVEAMRSACDLPITVKHRIGVDEHDRYEDMLHFVDVVAQAGPSRFTVHARKAWLNGLSTKENRTIPPLRHGEVHRLKRERPELTVVVNGGIRTLAEARAHLTHVDGVMIGRAATDDPWLFAAADAQVFGEPVHRERTDILPAVVDYTERHLAEGGRLHHVFRHLVHLYRGEKGSRRWRQGVSDACQASDPDPGVLFALADELQALQELRTDVLGDVVAPVADR